MARCSVTSSPRSIALEQHRDVALAVLLGAAKGEALVHHGRQRELADETREHPEDEHRAALAATRPFAKDRFPHQGELRAYRHTRRNVARSTGSGDEVGSRYDSPGGASGGWVQ